ncbi:hypothetical protein O181_052000 [Austropuccinia psidii MF-1]|uniref:Uncharacterized protein n=1 Tax=Austropuccinia psidii MF-1 TaxID=1389203 RepID=A0A9Q3E430_9BASI|nr:hypothetical protein [Austropuccinia psidii MF-1]
MTLSAEEWNSLQTNDVMYKRKHFLSRTYSILKPGAWADIMHSHFWEQTKFPCSISYKRAKIYDNGTNYSETPPPPPPSSHEGDACVCWPPALLLRSSPPTVDNID